MKTALITGASRGLGKEIASQLTAQGWRVISTSRTPYIGKILEMDVTDRNSVERLKFTLELEGLDLLINNAGVYLERDPILEAREDSLMSFLDVNAIGVMTVTQVFWDLLKAAQGRVVNISSCRGLTTNPHQGGANYAASKALQNHITRMFALQGEQDGVIVNGICPGRFVSPMGGETAPKIVEDAAREVVWLATQVPRSRTGKFYSGANEVAW